jgi:hypothetical protein
VAVEEELVAERYTKEGSTVHTDMDEVGKRSAAKVDKSGIVQL